MKVAKANTPAKGRRDYSRESKRQLQVTTQIQNEWTLFQQKAAELSKRYNANIIIMSHFPEGSKPTSMDCISTHGEVAKKYQQKDMLQLVASKFLKKCSQRNVERRPNEGESAASQSEVMESQHTDSTTETIPFVVNMIPCSIDNLVTNTANTTVADPASWPERADEIEGMELIVMAEEETPENVQNQSTTPVRLPGTPSKPNLSSPKTTSDNLSPKVVTLSNFSPTVVKCYTVSKNKENSSRRVLQAVQLRPKPLVKPVFHANGHTYASLDDGTVIKVVPVQFTRGNNSGVVVEEEAHHEEPMVEEIIEDVSQHEDGRSSASPALAGCVEVIMSSELTQAIEAMNNDVLAPVGEMLPQDESALPPTMDGGVSSGSDNNGPQKTERRGRPRKSVAGGESTSSPRNGVARTDRNNRANYKFKCDECSRAFRDSFDLKVHLRTHTGEKPFKCDQCEQSFSLKCTLKVHQLLHTGERPFQCELCDKSFTRSDYLTRHQLQHTGARPFTCPDPACNKTFALRGQLNKHQRSFNHYAETEDPLTTP